ncbi:PfkB family carbohydrate kinase [Treponema sp. Marseille-Q3903]|uniref:PfkB family carbohydrate kinase n=1 Tax=Treponema sp. Marseille-Q3903 TaxID=2766703 RepID=UPI00351C520A
MGYKIKNYDVTALGELLIDFTENGLSRQGNFLMEANPGGAPCNVLAILTKFGKKTAFIGKVGNDFLGHHLADVVAKIGIDTRNLLFDNAVHTTLAFVHTFEEGDRDFSFYRNPGADMMLRVKDVDQKLIADSKLFHLGTLSMTNSEVRKATKTAVMTAKKNGCLISFDPNLRVPLWNKLEEADYIINEISSLGEEFFLKDIFEI